MQMNGRANFLSKLKMPDMKCDNRRKQK